MTQTMWRRWLTEEDGQDLIEYALLASFMGFAAAGAVATLRTAMSTTYQSWDTANQSDALVNTPDPKK
jgi:Flp pilus assembly pilin Flp